MSEAIKRSRPGVDISAVAGVLGIVVPSFAVLILPIWDFPGTADSAAQVAKFAATNRGDLQAVMVLYTVGVTLWLVFGAGVWARLRAATDTDSIVPTCFAAGLIGLVTLLLAGFTAFDVLVYRPANATEARILYDLAFGLLAMSGMPTAVALGAYAIGIYRLRILPRHTAHLAVVASIAHVVLLLSFIAAKGPFSLEGPMITVVPAFLWAWILVTGLTILRRDAALTG
jgi:hypothetical protein